MVGQWEKLCADMRGTLVPCNSSSRIFTEYVLGLANKVE